MIINLFILGNEGRKVCGVSISSTVKILMRLSQKLNFSVKLRGSQRTALNRTEEHPLFRRPHVASSRGIHDFRHGGINIASYFSHKEKGKITQY